MVELEWTMLNQWVLFVFKEQKDDMTQCNESSDFSANDLPKII